MSARILIGHVMDKLAELPDESVHMVCTSPPYWGLRAYANPEQQEVIWPSPSADGCVHKWASVVIPAADGSLLPEGNAAAKAGHQGTKSATMYPRKSNTCLRCGSWRGALGREPVADCGAWTAAFRGEPITPCPSCWACHMLTVMREVRRVLRSDGVVFLNCGDSYASGKGTCHNPGGGSTASLARAGLKPKDLCLMPSRLALALQADGWWIRSDIIWAKKNPMPESVTDRPTSAHEHVLLLTKSARYFYDADAVREPVQDAPINQKILAYAGKRPRSGLPVGRDDRFAQADAGMQAGFSGRWCNSAGRNLRNVWTLATEPYPDAHFATYPKEIPRRCIEAGSPTKVCAKCGTGWRRVVEKTGGTTGTAWHQPGDGTEPERYGSQTMCRGDENDYRVRTLGFRPGCSCHGVWPKDKPCTEDLPTKPAVVLDPFAGSGTTAVAAEKLGRQWMGCEIDPEYAKIAEARIARERAQLKLPGMVPSLRDDPGEPTGARMMTQSDGPVSKP